MGIPRKIVEKIIGQELIDYYPKNIIDPPAKMAYGRFRSKVEAAYAAKLEIMKRAGEIIDWRYEEVKFRVGDGSYYVPDFMVLVGVGVYAPEFHEVKGYHRGRERGLVKFKAAKDRYPCFKWVLIDS